MYMYLEEEKKAREYRKKVLRDIPEDITTIPVKEAMQAEIKKEFKAATNNIIEAYQALRYARKLLNSIPDIDEVYSKCSIKICPDELVNELEQAMNILEIPYGYCMKYKD